MIAILGRFCSPGGGGINGSCGTYGSLLAWDSPFRCVGRGGGGWACGLCTKSRARPGHASPSEVYPAGKLQ